MQHFLHSPRLSVALATAPTSARICRILDNKQRHYSDLKECDTVKHPWDPAFATEPRLPQFYWTKPENQRNYLDWLGNQLGIKKFEDWYQVKQKDVVRRGGASIMKRYGSSFPKAVSSVYTEHRWLAWQFNQVAVDYWTDTKNHVKFCEEFMRENSMKSLSDWYRVKLLDVRKFGGSYLVGRVHANLPELLRSVYPDHKWLDWKFAVQPAGIWDRVETRRDFLTWFASRHGISRPEDWYKISTALIKKEGGVYLLKRYKSLMHQMLAETFPNHAWLPWRFPSPPRNFWVDTKNQHAYIQWLRETLHISSLEGLYSLTADVIAQNHGKGLLVAFGGSIPTIMKTVYPSHTWCDWLFLKVDNNFWDSEENHRRYFDWLAVRLGISSMEQWYSVSTEDVYSNHGAGMLASQYGGSVMRALLSLYPEHAWNVSRFRATAAVQKSIEQSSRESDNTS